MKAEDKIRKAADEAQEAGVKVQFMVTTDDYNRPLKTVKGALTKLWKYQRYGLWRGWIGIEFIGANGKGYKTAKLAAKYGKGGK